MQTFPMNALDFQKTFATEEQCRNFLFKLRWPHGFVCPNCNHDDGFEIATRQLIQCRLCNHQTSVTAGTMFHKTHLPLPCWFWIIYQMTQDKGGVAATRLSRELDRPYKTIWYIMQKIRHAMERRDELITLGGLIEMDEAKLGPEARRPANENPENQKEPRKKPYGLPSSKPGAKRKTIVDVLILTEAERFHAGNVAMKALDVLGFESIREFIEKRAEPGQWYRTDAHHSHWVLRQLSPNFQITKSDEAEGPEALPCVHRVINLLKHFLMGTYFGVSSKYLPGYLNEFCFRFIRRDKPEQMPRSLLQSCVFALPMTYAELKL